MKTRLGKRQAETKPVEVTEEEFRDHCDAYDGLCLACGAWSCGGVEPDAEGYTCEVCDARAVIGAEDALMMGKVVFS